MYVLKGVPHRYGTQRSGQNRNLLYFLHRETIHLCRIDEAEEFELES